MSNKKIYLYGAGGHSNVVAEVLVANGREIAGKFDDIPERNDFGTQEMPLPDWESFRDLDGEMIISVGRNDERAYLAENLNVAYAQAIHPTSIISSTARIGDGTVVLHGAIVQMNAQIGRHVLINTAASVDHDCFVRDFAHISPHATLCGHVEIGEGTHVGAGAIIIPSIKVGKWCIVGAGAVVIRDVPDFSTVVGTPARVIKTRAVPTPIFKREN